MRTIINCWNCYKPMRVPSEGDGNIKCPNCNQFLKIKNGKIEYLVSQKTKSFFSITKSHIIVFISVCVIFICVFIYNNYKSQNPIILSGIFHKEVYIEFDNSRVILHGVKYTVGLTSINGISTNISDLDDEAWEKLRQKSGIYPLIRKVLEKDKYGNINNEEYDFGKINLDELSKYQSLSDFKKAGGLWALIIKENN